VAEPTSDEKAQTSPLSRPHYLYRDLEFQLIPHPHLSFAGVAPVPSPAAVPHRGFLSLTSPSTTLFLSPLSLRRGAAEWPSGRGVAWPSGLSAAKRARRDEAVSLPYRCSDPRWRLADPAVSLPYLFNTTRGDGFMSGGATPSGGGFARIWYDPSRSKRLSAADPG
jgi:hypothetical protein